jgi:ribose transport system ATP-binding protein
MTPQHAERQHAERQHTERQHTERQQTERQHAERQQTSARPTPSAGQKTPSAGQKTPSAGQKTPPRLTVTSLSKTFGLSRVLDQVSLSIVPGEIHALVGHNGSGKSTLVKVLAGFHAPDPGCSATLDGARLPVPVRAADLAAGGITFVHQDLGLVDSLSVAENCRVGYFTARRWSRRIDWKAEHERVRSVLARLDSDLDPRALVGSLTAADRTTVAVARAVAEQVPGRGVIVLDEATRTLPRPAQEHLYRLVEGIADGGGAVVLVTHRVGEVLRLASRVSVLREGRLIASGQPTASFDRVALGELLAGRRDAETSHRPAAGSRKAPDLPGAASSAKDSAGGPPGPAFRVAGLAGRELAGISFEVSPGEILGVTGLIGSGADELPALLTGARRAAAGVLTVPSGTIELSRPALRRCLDAGVVLVPERRDADGLALGLSVRENLALPLVRRRARPWKVSGGWEDQLVRRCADDLDIRTAAGPDRVGAQPAGQLSGGNRQKVLLGKWLATGPRLLVLHEPTQGVDVGARAQLLALIRQAAAAGIAVVMASIEAEDLAAVCDRVLVLHCGHISAERPCPCASREIIQLTYQEAS